MLIKTLGMKGEIDLRSDLCKDNNEITALAEMFLFCASRTVHIDQTIIPALLDGKIVHFKENGLKIPHMGWNNLTIPSNTKLFKGLNNPYVYFVHSYHLVTDNKDYLLTNTTYGYEFSCAVEYKNIFATQFHPEKSGDVGLKILKNFGDL